jgi:hypothetical protein
MSQFCASAFGTFVGIERWDVLEQRSCIQSNEGKRIALYIMVQTVKVLDVFFGIPGIFCIFTFVFFAAVFALFAPSR